MSVSVNLLPANTSSIETDTGGWAAGTNTTLSQYTTNAYSGSTSLAMSRTGSAGPASATTSARVSVTAGQQYTAYAYFANALATSGRTAMVRIDWWAASSGGTAISGDTSAAVTVPSTVGQWTEPPPIVVATAPAGARYASVTITVTNVGVGTLALVDAVAFGPPNLIAGNLLDYGTQGLEVSAAGWQALTNCSISRASSPSYEGWWSLKISATAAGLMTARTVVPVPVTPGVEYLAAPWVYAPAAGGTFRVDIWWYDAAGTGISDVVATKTWANVAGATWVRLGVSGVAPPGAASAKVVVRPTASAAGEAWYVDQVLFCVAPILPGNLISYRAQCMDLGIEDWSARQGCTISRVTGSFWSGAASLKVACQTADYAIVDLRSTIPVTPGHSYSVSPHIRHATAPGVVPVIADFSWQDAAGVDIAASSYRWDMGQADGWYVPQMSAIAPTGAASMRVSLWFPDVASGTAYYIDEVFVGEGGLAALATPRPDIYGVSITLRGLATLGTSATWSLVRTLQDGSQTAVRGYGGTLSSVPVTSDVQVVEDYEAPLGVPVTYRLTIKSGSTSINTTAGPIVLDAPDGQVVIKDVGAPARNGAFVVQTVPNWTRSARMGVSNVRGRARPIVISDVRSSRTGSLVLVTETPEEVEALWWLLETGSTLLLQWPADWSLSDMYVQVGDVTEERISPYARQADRTWTLALTEVDRPVGGMAGSSIRTWQTIKDQYATWGDLLGAYDSWLDVLTGVRGS